jgi:hypothetical protein
MLSGTIVDDHHGWGGGGAPRTLAAVYAISHHEQWSRASFNIGGKEGCFFSNSLKIEMAR